jgi:DNA N-6-adenine-methyltransferase (Dam)
MSALVNYNAARQALAAAHAIDEVKDIRDKAVAMAHYAVMAKDTELSRHATEIRLRAERRLGELMAEQPKAKGAREPNTNRGTTRGSTNPASLADQGIDKNLAKRARQAAAMPEEKYEAKIRRQTDMAEKAASAIGKAAYPKAEFSGENEWYTPAEYIEYAREALGCIDLDPASSDMAQSTVKAQRCYTVHDDGLGLEWHGRVWLNPPYSRELIGKFIDKLVDEYTVGRTESAILLTHNSTDTAWFRTAQETCSAICFTDSRIRFYNADGEVSAPSQGQAFFYFGPSPDRFADVFAAVGFIVIPRHAVPAMLAKHDMAA